MEARPNVISQSFYLFFGLFMGLVNMLAFTHSTHSFSSSNVNHDSNLSCKIYWNIDPFDEFIIPFLKKKTFECEISEDITFVDENGVLRIKVDDKAVTCYYSFLCRHFDYEPVLYTEPAILTKNGVQMDDNHMFANVSCYSPTFSDYKNNHYFIPNFHSVKPNPTKPSVIVLTIESLSRLSFLRFMNKSMATMNEIGHFHFFKAFHRVEQNSFPNAMALLAGVPMTDEEGAQGFGQFWDNYTFLWDHFNFSGYVTAFIEDVPNLGLFTWYKRGFFKSPTHFYPLPFWSQMYLNATSNIDKILNNSTNYCFEKAGPKIDIFLNQILEFGQKMKGQAKPYFVYSFFAQMTHEDFNNFALIDQSISTFLKQLRPLLDNTLLVIMGDHGPRVGSAVDSPMGLLETSLPFLSIRLPSLLGDKYSHLSNYLELNEERLTTPFDVRQMLLDVASGLLCFLFRLLYQFIILIISLANYEVPSSLESSFLTNVTTFSIFRQQVPFTRNCESANINPVFCTCNGVVNIYPKIGYHHVEAAKELVAHLNQIILQNNCTLKLKWARTEKGSVSK